MLTSSEIAANYTLIRVMTLNDWPAVLLMAEAMHAESAYCGTEFSAERVKETFRGLVDQEHGITFIAEVKGEVVGMFIGYVTRHFFSDELLAQDLVTYIVPEHRKGTLAFGLVNAYTQTATRLNVSMIQLGATSGTENDRVAQLFSRLGYERSGTVLRRKPV